MEEVNCRLLPYTVADGPRNMAADEVLLESAAAGVASLRFYGWAEPTLSLGYFQPERVRREEPCLTGLPYVRRLSGGAALVHHHEVTYALGLPAGPPWHTRQPWRSRMHAIIAAALHPFGVAALVCSTEQGVAPTLCFQHLMPGDLAIGPAKVAGSAQRRQRGALLQHGAVLLAASSHLPDLLGIRELTGRSLTVPTTCQAIRSEFSRQTGWSLVAADWTAAELQRTNALVATKYVQETWNNQR